MYYVDELTELLLILLVLVLLLVIYDGFDVKKVTKLLQSRKFPTAKRDYTGLTENSVIGCG
jgi:hypothetical protein